LQFFTIMGTRKKFIGSSFNAFDAVLPITQGRDHDDGDKLGCLILLQATAGFKTINARHHNIKQNEFGPMNVGQFDTFPAAGGFQ
jgi:hypothetical protein